MTSREHASKIASEYLKARRKFEHEAEQDAVKKYLGGNDNFIGRIGDPGDALLGGISRTHPI